MYQKRSFVFTFVLGVCAMLAGAAIHSHIAKVRAAKLDSEGPPAPYFPAGAIWTKDVSQEPADPQSAPIIAWLADAGGWGHGRLQVDFSFRVLQANASTPLVPFRKADPFYAGDSDSIKAMPLPAGGGIEGQNDYQCDVSQNDCHLIVVDRSNAKLYEAYKATAVKDAISASFVGVWDLNRVYPFTGRGDQCTSADAAGFPIAPLLFNADELSSGSINHAIRFILPNSRIRSGVYVRPATHAGGPKAPTPAPPYGVHFRLKSSYDLSRLKPSAQVVARALQKYGMYLADGGYIALTAQSDLDTTTKYSDVDFDSNDLQDLKVTDFEVVDLGTPIRVSYDCVRNK